MKFLKDAFLGAVGLWFLTIPTALATGVAIWAGSIETKAKADVGPDRPRKTAEKAPEPALKTGIYQIQGERGVWGAAALEPNGDAWLLTTTNGVVGHGIRRGNTLSVGWALRTGHGVAVYRILADSQLEGEWTGGGGTVHTETLTLLKELTKWKASDN